DRFSVDVAQLAQALPQCVGHNLLFIAPQHSNSRDLSGPLCSRCEWPNNQARRETTKGDESPPPHGRPPNLVVYAKWDSQLSEYGIWLNRATGKRTENSGPRLRPVEGRSRGGPQHAHPEQA